MSRTGSIILGPIKRLSQPLTIVLIAAASIPAHTRANPAQQPTAAITNEEIALIKLRCTNKFPFNMDLRAVCEEHDAMRLLELILKGPVEEGF